MRNTFSWMTLIATLLIALAAAASAQELPIPDPDLNAAIRAALQKPAGPLTEADLLTLTNLNACCRNIQSLEGLGAARNLVELQLENNQLTSFAYATNWTQLQYLDLSANPLASAQFPDGLTNLTSLNLDAGALTGLILPRGLSGLTFLHLGKNQLTNLVLNPDLRNLQVLGLESNLLDHLDLPASATNLTVLNLPHNRLTSLTIPSELTRLTSLLLGGNPLESLVLSEAAATSQFAAFVASLRNGGISVYTYPTAARLSSPALTTSGYLGLTLTGPPGVYTIHSSTDLTTWIPNGALTNSVGSATFTTSDLGLAARQFYRAQLP